MTRIVLAHSGSFETSAAIPWLADHFSSAATSGGTSPAEVIAVIVETGRRTDLVELREQALALGALRCHVVDSREEFAREYVLPALQAQAFSGERPPLSAALARAIVARKVVELARMEEASAIAFGCGRVDDRAPLGVLIRALDPSFELVVPSALWAMSDSDLRQYAKRRNIQRLSGLDGAQQVTANVWGRLVMFDLQQNSWTEPSEDLYMLTRAPKDCPDQPAYVEVEFERGVPVRVNCIEMPLLEMIESLETIGGTHGVGRTDSIVTRLDGQRIRHIGEAPAAAILQMAHRELEGMVTPPELARLVSEVGGAYANLVQTGGWFSQTRAALDGFTAAIQPTVTGWIRLRLFKGDCRIVGRRAPVAGDDTQPTAAAASAPDGVPGRGSL